MTIQRFYGDPVGPGKDTVRRRPPRPAPSAVSLVRAAGNAPAVTRPVMQFLAGEEREQVLVWLAKGLRPQLATLGWASQTIPAAVAMLTSMERILDDHFESCSECANALGSIRTAKAFAAAWNSLKPGDAMPPGYLWWPDSTLVPRPAQSG